MTMSDENELEIHWIGSGEIDQITGTETDDQILFVIPFLEEAYLDDVNSGLTSDGTMVSSF